MESRDKSFPVIGILKVGTLVMPPALLLAITGLLVTGSIRHFFERAMAVTRPFNGRAITA